MNGPSDSSGEFRIECNENGDWQRLADEWAQRTIVNMAQETHAATMAIHPELRDFKDMLDACARYWLDQKILVEDEARKYGFKECEDIAKLSMEDQRKAAILALSENGSLLLLGNGCLTATGSSARYQRIPIRQILIPPQLHAPRDVRCTKIPRLKEEIFVSGPRFNLAHTSPARLLYVTTDRISDDDQLRVSESLSGSISGLNETVFGIPLGDTIGPLRRRDLDDVPEPEVPEYV